MNFCASEVFRFCQSFLDQSYQLSVISYQLLIDSLPIRGIILVKWKFCLAYYEFPQFLVVGRE
jgi:hypothetical protein